MTLPSLDRKVRNVTGHEHCAACIDGWVALKGAITTGGTTYERGRAPCRWCEQGVARIQRHPHLETNFTGADIELPETPGRVTHPVRRPPTRLVRSIESVPPTPPETPETAQNGSNHEKPAQQEPTSAPQADDRDQPVEDIDDMDIPF